MKSSRSNFTSRIGFILSTAIFTMPPPGSSTQTLRFSCPAKAYHAAAVAAAAAHVPVVYPFLSSFAMSLSSSDLV